MRQKVLYLLILIIFMVMCSVLLDFSANAAVSMDDFLAGRFAWTAGPPLIGAANQANPDIIAIKDPTIVQAGGRWHVYATLKLKSRPACMEYLSFSDWAKADAAPRQIISLTEAYHCAPQVFYFTPQHKWYLLYQYTDKSITPPNYGPALSTIEDAGKPETLGKPVMLFEKKPENIKGWLDFWIICDAQNAFLFFTSDDGHMWRSQTTLADFPRGWTQPVLALKGDIFEASHTYRLKGLNKYLTIIEALGRGGSRYYKAYLADRLDGEWRPLAGSAEKPFASMSNVRFDKGVEPWNDSISHGELLRDGNDETMPVDPENLQLLYQGCSAQERAGKNYGQLPWRLGLLKMNRPEKQGIRPGVGFGKD